MIIRFLTIALLCTLLGCEGKSKEALYSEGVAELSKANPGGAVMLLKSALEKDPAYQDARFLLAKAYLACGKFDLALKEFGKVSPQSPASSEIPLELARFYLSQKQPDKAVLEGEKYTRLHPEHPEALEILGVAQADSDNIPRAESYLLRARNADPRRASAWIELAVLYARHARGAEVRSMLDGALQAAPKNARALQMLADLEVSEGNDAKGLELYSRAARANPSDPGAPYKTGMLLIKKGESAKAEAVAADLAGRFPKSAEGYRLQGLLKYGANNYVDAIPLLQRAIQIAATPESFYYLGLCLYGKGELEQALSQFRAVLDVNPASEPARLLTGTILLKQGRVGDCIAEAGELLQASRGHAPAHNLLASAYLAQGSNDQALREFDRALALDPKIADAHLKKGVFHFQHGRLQAGESELQAALRIAPEILDTRLLLGGYYLRVGDFEKALALLRQGLNGKKSDAVLYNNMAACMFGRNRRAEGVALLGKAKQADPDYLAAYFNLAIHYSAGDEPEKALQEYRAVLLRFPRNLQALLSMASLLELKGRDQEAFGYYTQAKGTREGGAYLALANHFLKKGEGAKALAVLDEALVQSGANLDALEMKGEIFLRAARYQDALSVYNDIYSVNPDLGLQRKVTTYLAMKEPGKALEEARRYISFKPNAVYGYQLLSIVYENGRDPGRAVEELQNGVRLDPGSTRGLLALGDLHARLKEYGPAGRWYQQALQLDGAFLPALFAQGALLEACGDKIGAVRKYREVLSKSESYMPALNNLAYLYTDDERLGGRAEGLRLAFTSFKLAPENPATLDPLGYSLVKNGRAADAVRTLEKAAALLPGNSSVAYHLALAYGARGSRDLASRSLRRALSLGPFPESERAQKLLGATGRATR